MREEIKSTLGGRGIHTEVNKLEPKQEKAQYGDQNQN